MREFQWHVVARSIVTAFLALAAFLASYCGYVSSAWPLAGVCGGILAYEVAPRFGNLLRLATAAIRG